MNPGLRLSNRPGPSLHHSAPFLCPLPRAHCTYRMSCVLSSSFPDDQVKVQMAKVKWQKSRILPFAFCALPFDLSLGAAFCLPPFCSSLVTCHSSLLFGPATHGRAAQYLPR